MMSREQSSMNGRDEILSALVDGEAGREDVAKATAARRSDAELRRTWHAYQLIGDVLRSDDRQRPRARRAIRAATARPAGRRAGGAGAAAGGDGLAGRRPIGPSLACRCGRGGRLRGRGRRAGGAAGAVARAGTVGGPGPSSIVPATTMAPMGAEPAGEHAVLVTDGQLIRDARLDRYLAAHQRFAGASALGVPSSFLRSATTDAAQR
ncbi:hypothetical protein FSC37_03410 [Piscinibacter aquaticus]|uniref:Anti sigma-E protein RseA N-terminal domain-containing protein n=1 Tax=Piscinibacter aquaticus TaxID=392597 RepID=A0A5C6U160_9BURK|nr:hypothetical protein FSC37_03410 [Piscinibacter aquaticus]